MVGRVRRGVMLAVALAAGQLAAAPAFATLLFYDFDPGANNAGAFSFRLDDQAPPQDVEPGRRFVAAITAGTGVYAGKPGITFYAGQEGGGVGITAGPQLYGGTEAAPAYLTGRFVLGNFLANGATGLLTVSAAAPGAVPEPAAWALMLAGFGLVGGVLRRRAPTMRAA